MDPIDRLCRLGHPAPGRHAQFASLSSLPDTPTTPPKAQAMMRLLVDGHEAVARLARGKARQGKARQGIFPLAEKASDEPTADLLTQALRRASITLSSARRYVRSGAGP